MNKPDLKNVYDKLAARREGGVELQQYLPLGDGTFKIVASVSRVADENTFAQAIASLTDSRARLVPGTLKSNGRVASAVVKANTVSRAMDASFTPFGKEMASDSEGRLWSVREVDGAKHVVLESSDDLAELFQKRCNARKSFLSPIETRAATEVASFANGDLVSYVDTAAGSVRAGLVFNVAGQTTVVDPQTGVTRPIKGDTVMRATARTELPAPFAASVQPYEAKAALSPEKLSTILAYLRKAYGEASTEMLEKMARIAGTSLPGAATPSF